jgi:uncharacterized membrane protein YhaH (DUF805 family)
VIADANRLRMAAIKEIVMRKRMRLVCLLLFLALPAVTRTAAAQTDETLTLTATAGYDSYFKDGQWVPLHVSVANSGAPIDGTFQVVTGNSPNDRVVYTSPVSLPTQSDKRITFYVYLPGFASDLDLVLLDENGDEMSAVEVPVRRLSQNALLYTVVSDESVALDLLENVSDTRTEAVVAYVGIDNLPDAAPAWNGIDVLVFSNVNSGQLSLAQREALEAWLDAGGQLVVTGGTGWQKTVAAFDGLLPATPTGGISVDDLPALRTRLGAPFRDPGPYLITESNLRAGELLLHEEGLPILARAPKGKGAVYFLALDPSAPPLLDWAGSEELWSLIAERLPDIPVWTQGPRNSYSAGQAIGSLASLRLPSTLWLFLFILFYVIVIGPVNYLILKRLHRREWAWISVPGIVLLFSAIAYLTGFRLRGNEIIVNQMSVAYGHVEGQHMKVNSLLGLYSPTRSTYDVRLPSGVLARPFDRNSGTMVGAGNLQAIERGSETILRRVRVDVSSMETFVADSVHPLPAITGDATLHLDAGGGELEMHVQNNSSLSLKDAGLMFGPLFTALGDLEPGADRTEIQRLTTRQAAAVAGSGVLPVSYGGVTPFSPYYADLLGTSTYYDDPDAFPRFQFLESFNYYGGPSGPAISRSNGSALYLLGWSDEPYVDVALQQSVEETPATTFYILELPVTGYTAAGSGVDVPLEMMNWNVLGESGVYAPSITSFYMPYGWVEFEYEPWPLFHDLEVTELAVVLEVDGQPSSQLPPRTSLWHWGQEEWIAIPNVVWGEMSIGDYTDFLGPLNQVRIRLENDTGDLNIRAIYPALSGNLE